MDVTFAIRNDGNATTAYDLNLAAPQLAGLDYELIVYRLNETPVAQGCELTTEAQQQLIFNQSDPLNNAVDGSFYLEPGQEVLVTFSVLPDGEADTPANPVTTFVSNDLCGLVSAQPPNTDPVTQPLPVDQFGPPTSCEIAGDWSGTYLQPGFSPFPMTLTNLECGTPGSVIANVEYSSLGCSGTWTLDAIVGSSLLVTETVSGGSCVPVVEHELLGLDGGTLRGITPDFNSSFSLSRVGASTFTETVITGDADILSDGILIAANDLGVSPSPVTVNGVTFGTDQGGLIGLGNNGGGDFSVDGFSANLDALLSDLKFTWLTSPVSLTIGGLTPGVDYRLQLLFSNDVNPTGNEVEVTVEGETWILDDWQPGAINLIANFNASSPSVVVTFAPATGSDGTSGRAVLNAYAIHAAPFTNSNINYVSLNTTNLTIDGPLAFYTANISNNSGGSLSPVSLQTYIEQPGASRAAGGLTVSCGGTGVLPPGGCDVSFSLNANNTTSAGSGTLIPGPATARFDLIQGGTVIGTFAVPITLASSSPPVTTPLITAATPDPMAPGFGQLVTFTIANAPGLIRGVDIVYARNDVTGFTTTFDPNDNFVYGGTTVRLNGSLRPTSGADAGTVWVEYGNGDRSNDFTMTFRSTPAAPIITEVRTATGCGDNTGTVVDPVNDTFLAGDYLRITAQGLDTSTALVDVQTVQNGVPSTYRLDTVCPGTDGANYFVQIPASVNAGPFTLEIRANQTNAGGGPGDYAVIALNQ